MQETEIIIIVIAGTLLLLLMGLFIILALFFYQKSHDKYLKEKEELQREFEQTILQSRLEIQEQTLQHVSHELHDNLGQVASLIKIHLNTLRLDDQNDASDKIETSKELTRQLIADLKSLSLSLGSGQLLRNGFLLTLTNEIERLRKIGTLKITAFLPSELPYIKDETAVILYRMVQEILNNALKHSRATDISLRLTNNENIIILAIIDNGVGFDFNAATHQENSSGLHNLQDRARLIHAQLSIESAPGAGTSISIMVTL